MRTISKNIFPSSAKLKMSQISDYEGFGKCSHVILSNGKIVQSCSENYGHLLNENFFKSFEEKMRSEGINFTPDYRNVNDSYFVADYTLEGEITIATKKDIIQPKIRLINSYDGSCKTQGYLGYFRKVCENGLHAFKYDIELNLKHTEGNIKLVLPSINTMLEKYQATEGINIIKRFEVLAESPVVNIRDFVIDVTIKSGIFKFEKSDKNPEPSINSEFVLNTIARESNLLNFAPNKWLVYNAFNEWLYNENRNQKHDTIRRELDINVFETIEAI